MPEGNFKEVRQIIDEYYYYELDAEDSVEDSCDVWIKNRNSPTHREKHRGEYDILVMKDKISKMKIVEKEAVPLEKSEVGKEDSGWKTSVTMVESSSEAMSNRGSYKWFPLGNNSKRV